MGIERMMRELLIGALIAAFTAHAEVVFKTDCEDFTAAVGSTRVSAVITNATFVTGVKGRAFKLNGDSCVRFLDKTAFAPLDSLRDRGAMSFWIKLDEDVYRNQDFYDRDRLLDGTWGALAGRGCLNRDVVCMGSLRTWGCLIKYAGLLNLNCALNVQINRKMRAGEWHHVAADWVKGGQLRVWLDGQRIGTGSYRGQSGECGYDRLTIGSDRKLTLPCAMDEILFYDVPFADADVEALFASHMPVRNVQCDYTVAAGEPGEIRVRSEATRTGKVEERKIPVAPHAPGLFSVKIDEGKVSERRFDVYALSPKVSNAECGEKTKRLVLDIDCATKPTLAYNDTGNVVIKDGVRQMTSTASYTGFAYKLPIAATGVCHRLEFDYLDEGYRNYAVLVFPENHNRIWGCTFDNVGVLTGGDYPATGKLQTKSLYIWPDSDICFCAVNFRQIAALTGGPAISRIRLYECPAESVKAKASVNGRAFGVWQEDPTMDEMWFKNPLNYDGETLASWIERWERCSDYMARQGLTEWYLQVIDYDGDVTGMQDVFRTWSWHRMPGWADAAAGVFNRDGRNFWLRFGIRSGNGDWFWKIGDRKTPIGEMRVGSASGGYVDNGYAFLNPYHPYVQDVYVKIVRAYCERYAKYPTFRGISWNEFRDLGLRGIDNGYDDFTMRLFARETGVEVPLSLSFHERRNYLVNDSLRKAKWVSWRCRKTTELARRLTAAMQEIRADLKLEYWISHSFVAAASRSGDYDRILKEACIDAAKLSSVPGLIVRLCIAPDSSRSPYDRPSNVEYAPYDPSFAAFCRASGIRDINVVGCSNMEFCWNFSADNGPEKWGKWWTPMGMNLVDHVTSGFPTPHPSADYVMEPYAHLLAELDVRTFISGWWSSPENGEHDAYEKFYRSVLAIPEGRYEMVDGLKDDPLAVRASGKAYYIVNRYVRPVRATWTVDGVARSRTFAPCEVFSEKGVRVADLNVSVASEDTADLVKAMRKIENVVKTSSDAIGVEVRPVLDEMRKAYTEGRYARCRQLTRHEFAQKAIATMPISQFVTFDTEKGLLRVRVVNSGERKFKGTLSFAWRGRWKGDFDSVRVEGVPAGESREFEIPYRRIEAGPGYYCNFTMTLAEDGGARKSEDYSWPIISFASVDRGDPPAREIGVNRLLCDESIRKRVVAQAPRVKYGLWRAEDGSYLRFAFDVCEKDFVPPTDIASMYLEDCVQIYIDQRGNTKDKQESYDADDITFAVGLYDGKPTLWRETGAPAAVDAPVAITRDSERGITHYDVKIPKALLPAADLSEDGQIRWSFQVNNRMFDAEGKFHSCLVLETGGCPYLKPCLWVLTKFKPPRVK